MNKLLLLFSLFIFQQYSFCQMSNILWSNSYDNNELFDVFQSVKQTSDSSFICCGTSLEDFWLVKVYKNGNTIWNKTFGPKESDLVGRDIIEFNNNYYGVGRYNDANSEPSVLVVKYDVNGSFKWMKNYEYYHTGVLGSNSIATSIVKTTDSNFMIAASCFYITESIGTEDVWLLKVNFEGDTVWTRRYDLGLQYYDTPNSIVETPDSGFVIVGEIEGPYTSPTLTDLFILKVDKNGNKLWQKIYGGTGWDSGKAVKMTKDNGFIIVGQIGKDYFDYEQNSDIWLLKTDKNGDTLWSKTYGGSNSEWGNSIEITPDNGFIMTGVTETYGAGFWDVWVVRTDSLGDTLWTKTFGDSSGDLGYSICKSFDNGYIIGGQTRSFTSNTYDGYLIRFGPEIPVGVKDEKKEIIPTQIKLEQNYPNPFNPSTTIKYQIPNQVRDDNFYGLTSVRLNVFDILGREVAILVNEYQKPGNYSINFNADDLSSGVYYYQLIVGNFIQTKKMILLK